METLTKSVTPEKLNEKRTTQMFGAGLADQLKNAQEILNQNQANLQPHLFYKNQIKQTKNSLLGHNC